MLGTARAKAAPLLFVLLSALAVHAGLSVFPEAAHAAKKSKKKKAPVTSTDDDSSDIVITTVEPDPATKKKPAAKKPTQKGKKAKTEEVQPEEIELEEEPEAPAPPPEEEEAKPRLHLNWITFTVQQDILLHTTTGDICPSTNELELQVPGAEQYTCVYNGQIYSGPVVTGVGNTVQGGFGLATTRIMLGFDRVFVDKLTLGGRLGWAFGTAPSVEGAGKAFPLHIEVRSAYYFGNLPFERRSFRPYASLGVGVGEIDDMVPVDVYGPTDAPPVRVDAWRKTGTGFFALGLGLGYPIGDFSINAEVRAILLVGASAFALGPSLGAAYGF
jgi:hypothetical protein